MTQINVPLLRKTMEYASDHPEEIDLKMWARVDSCGTTMCIAGTAITLAGHRIDWSRPERVLESRPSRDFFYLTDGRLIEEVAEEELGLTPYQASELFFSRDLDSAWAVVENITDGEISRSSA